ncbi:MAG: hypothetical protein KDD56_05655 [Bdellovibrionales bacterium]|nr:hypothetical protein [Bdellovibrionales bacterium]
MSYTSLNNTSALNARPSRVKFKSNLSNKEPAVDLLSNPDTNQGMLISTVNVLIESSKYDKKTELLVASLLDRKNIDDRLGYVVCQYLMKVKKPFFGKHPYLDKFISLLDRKDRAAVGALKALEHLGAKAKAATKKVEELLHQQLDDNIREQVVRTFKAINPRKAKNFFETNKVLENQNYPTKDILVLQNPASNPSLLSSVLKKRYLKGNLTDDLKREVSILLSSDNLDAESTRYACLLLSQPGGKPVNKIGGIHIENIAKQLKRNDAGVVGALKALKSLRQQAQGASEELKEFLSRNLGFRLRDLASETLKAIDPKGAIEFFKKRPDIDSANHQVLISKPINSEEFYRGLYNLFQVRNKLKPEIRDLIAKRILYSTSEILTEKTAYMAALCLFPPDGKISREGLSALEEILNRGDKGSVAVLRAFEEVGTKARASIYLVKRFINMNRLGPKLLRYAESVVKACTK